jgi:hypothetical protein
LAVRLYAAPAFRVSGLGTVYIRTCPVCVPGCLVRGNICRRDPACYSRLIVPAAEIGRFPVFGLAGSAVHLHHPRDGYAPIYWKRAGGFFPKTAAAEESNFGEGVCFPFRCLVLAGIESIAEKFPA